MASRNPPNKRIPASTIFKLEEVAEMLRIPVTTMKAMRRAGKGPRPIWLGEKTCRYRMSAIEEYLTRLEATGHYEWAHDPK